MAAQFDNINDASVLTYANLRRRGRITQIAPSQWELGYTPTDSTDWPTPPPTSVWEGLDRLADALTRVGQPTVPMPRRSDDGRKPFVAATDSQAAIAMLVVAISRSGQPTALPRRSDDSRKPLLPSTPVASAVGFLPTGGIAATDVQTAIAELDTDKASLAQTRQHIFLGIA